MKSGINNGVAMITMLVLCTATSWAEDKSAVQQPQSGKQTQAQPARRSSDVVEGFEASLGDTWAVDSKKQANISSEVAHSGKQSLRFAYVTDKLVPRATLRFQPLTACEIEFWLLVSRKGFLFSGWDDMGFSWKALETAKRFDGPALVVLNYDQSIEAMTLQKPAPPETDLTPRTPKGGKVFKWTLKEQFPVGKWFSVRMLIHANRRIEFFIADKYAGAIVGDSGEAIDGIEWGGGLSLQAMNYEVYLDDVRVSPLQEDAPPKPRP